MFTVDTPRHLGLMHAFKVSSTAQIQGEKNNIKKEAPLIDQPLRMSFSLASIKLTVGIESYFVKHCLQGKQVLNIT